MHPDHNFGDLEKVDGKCSFISAQYARVRERHTFPRQKAPKNSHVADVARLPFGQFVYSARTNVLLSHKHHVHCAQAERTAFHYVFVEIEQKISGEIACFSGAQKQPCGRCCATAVRSIRLFSPYKRVVIAQASCSLCASRENSFSLRIC